MLGKSLGVFSMGARVALLASAPTGAPAQALAQNTVAPVAPGARLQEIDLIGRLIYDSNVTGGNAALAKTRGLSTSDEIFAPAIQFNLARPIGRETVFLQGSAGYDFHVHNTILNRENLDIRPGVLASFASCQTALTGNYSRAQSDISQLALGPGSPNVTQQRNVLEVKQISGNADCGRAIGFAPNVSASETWTSNSSPLQRFTDAQTFSGSAGLAYRRPTFGSLSVFGSYSHTDYPNRAAFAFLFPGLSTSFQTISGGVSFARAIGTRLQANASLSYTSLESGGSTSRSFSGPTFSGALSYRASSRLRASAQISRATAPSNRLNSTYAIEELYSAQIVDQVGTKWGFSGGASYGHNSYRGLVTQQLFDLTDEKTYTVFGDAVFQFTRRLSLDLNVQHSQRNANFPGLTYPDTRVGLTARATF